MVAVSIRELFQRFAVNLICQLHLNRQELLDHRIGYLAEVCAYCKRTEGQNYQRQGRNKHPFQHRAAFMQRRFYLQGQLNTQKTIAQMMVQKSGVLILQKRK